MAIPSTPTPPAAAQTGDGVDIAAARARGGYPGRRILWMLLASLALVLVAFLIAFAVNPTPASEQSGAAKTTDPAAAEIFHAPEPAPKVPG